MTPLTGSRRLVAVTDHVGQVRTGPPGAWWSNLKFRPSHRLADVRMDVELPSGRAVAWNLGFLTFEAGVALWAHAEGVSWGDLALGVGAVLAGGIALVAWFLTVYTPRARARERARISAANLQADRRRRARHQAAQPQSTGQPQPQPHPALTASQ